MARQPLVGIRLPIIETSRSHSDTPQSLGLYGRVINSSQGPLPDNTQYSQDTDIHAHGGIRNHNLGKRAAADPHLRPRGYRDWQFTLMPIDKTTTHKLRVLKASLATNTSSGPNHLHVFLPRILSHVFFPLPHRLEQHRWVPKCTYVQLRAKRAQEGSTGITLPIFKLVARTGGRSKSRAGCFTSGKETR